MWGCSEAEEEADEQQEVFPTYVGMFRGVITSITLTNRFPHVCGDVPFFADEVRRVVAFSPRMWGCSYVRDVFPEPRIVFPTYVGMFRSG